MISFRDWLLFEIGFFSRLVSFRDWILFEIGFFSRLDSFRDLFLFKTKHLFPRSFFFKMVLVSRLRYFDLKIDLDNFLPHCIKCTFIIIVN